MRQQLHQTVIQVRGVAVQPPVQHVCMCVSVSSCCLLLLASKHLHKHSFLCMATSIVTSLWHFPSLSIAYAGPGRLMLSNVVLANFTLSSPSLKGALALWPQGMLQPGVQPGTTSPRKLYMHDVKILVSAQSLQENIRYFQNTTVEIYTVSAHAAHAAHALWGLGLFSHKDASGLLDTAAAQAMGHACHSHGQLQQLGKSSNP
jgi:hypothetical protein